MKVAVLAGGTSTEREVSLITGAGIYRALKEKGHKAVLIDVYLGLETDADKLDDIYDIDRDWAEGINAIKEESPDLEEIKKLRKDDKKCFFGPNVLEICKRADVVFMALHGANGEDGKIQATFELLGIPYTGTDHLSSAICMNKMISKDIMRANDIPTPAGYSMRIGDPIKEIGYPAVVKVNNGGSSVGTYIVNDRAEFESALKAATKYDEYVVVEQFVKGREFTCGLIEGKALPIVEIMPKEGGYDYKNKYQSGKTLEVCPAEISEEKTKEIQAVAEKVFRVLRLKAYARIDFMMDAEENIYCLEANTLPGMTPVSLFPQEAAAIGMSYGDLCEKLIEVSLK
ncbi:MAG: D-alanine--D-alanine ligase [Firmicutes bacterium ADurb.Bin354]|nr:MAG: D-alanine--D-alanine ligase [Firmicutes bacterium ADurb.Bin354]